MAKYRLLQLLEFSSERKRMSVIVERETGERKGEIILLIKGADDAIFERLD